MEIEGVGGGKDFKLWPGGGRIWDWRETGTQHQPGIQPGDVQELLEHGAAVIVLGRGRELALHVDDSTVDLLRERGVAVHVEETGEAIDRYNRLASEGVAVAGLFHSTC